MEEYINLLDLKKEEWDKYLDSLTSPEKIHEINKFYYDKMLIEDEKFFVKGNVTAGRRARIFAQKMKDLLQRYRNLITSTKKQ